LSQRLAFLPEVTVITNLPLAQLKNLTKTYTEGKRRRVILNEVNVTFNAGEFILILGQSGSGKSTLLNLMSGIDAPDSGDILINEVVINRLTEHQRTLFRRQHIGLVFQTFNLIPTLTVFENVISTIQLNGRVTSVQKKEVLALLDQVGLAARCNTFPDRLSGGEQQRVAILRAVAHQPTLLLADEPTGNLDKETGGAIIQLLLELTRAARKTLIMASHNLAYIPLADRVYHLEALTLQPQLIENTPPG